MATKPQSQVDGRECSPVELSSLRSQEAPERFDAANRVATSAVITVPANFADEARRATIKPVRALAWPLPYRQRAYRGAFLLRVRAPSGRTVVVYDFGGGTLDVSIARVNGRSVEILTSRGDPRLGGKEFDERLYEIITSRYQSETGDTFDPGVHGLDGKSAEGYKKQLTTRDEISVQVSGGNAGRHILRVSRAEFESETRKLMTRADMCVEAALEEAGLARSDISDVFLVGGSSGCQL